MKHIKSITLFSLFFISFLSAQLKFKPWIQVYGKPEQYLGSHVGSTAPTNNYPYNINVGSDRFSEHYLLKHPNDTSKKFIFKEYKNIFADMNGDKIVDMISVVDLFYNSRGYAKIFYGTETGFDYLNPLLILGENRYDEFRVALIYDLNKDSINDLICAAPYYEKQKGKIYVYYGPVTRTKTTPDFTILGDSLKYGLGVNISAGDLNDDGFTEILVQGDKYIYPTHGIKILKIYWGNELNNYSENTELITIDGGSGILNSFDVNGDNVNDLIWAIRNDRYGDSVVIYYGGVNFDTIYDLKLKHFASNILGSMVYKANINNDKYNDIIFTVPSLGSGYVFVFYGGPNIDADYETFIDGKNYGSWFGGSIDSTGDLNGDGISEIIIGASDDDNSKGYWGIFTSNPYVHGTYNKENDLIPNNFKLFNAYPNPFNPTTTIKFEIPQDAFINLKVYDILGREIQTLIFENMKSGNYSSNFNASYFPSGAYFYQLIAQKNNKILFSESKKLILVK